MTRIDRRALFTSGAAAALLAATGTAQAQTPRTGGVLRLALPRDGGSMDLVARGAVFDTLTEIGPEGLLRAELATQWSSSHDARVWRFDLRSDVTFHKGQVFGAQDVVASLQESEIAQLGAARIDALSPYSVQVSLAAANPHLPYLLADHRFAITADGDLSGDLTAANGTGCYRVERARNGRDFRATRMRDHYKSGHAGWVDTVELVVIPDAAVRAEALRDGYVDVAALPAPAGLLSRGSYQYHPSANDMALAASHDVGIPRAIGNRSVLDDGRIAERWWCI
ncbi:ABC transporter substrate-binding protein [Phaeobacter porticola]|uniref:Putative extracellular solute-binding protein n=1 Tax=Phaeobacter porticola TaxID=1844006 RepID=A0A1L3I9S6_9RHOB|nr:ABC transporter substrate-binding protein [Phaeobacter porticola]APG48835.1 putative extracellular solute-binding protein [Phaeobacter porticola]